MPLYSMIAKDKDPSSGHRQQVRPVHLVHLENLGDKLIIAGPLQNDDGAPIGSLVVIEADSLEAAKALYARDPFVTEGVFGSYEVARFALTINKSAGR